MIDPDKIINLIDEALRARERAYSPYSGYTVGAALLCGNGRIYKGANIENASYGATNCAERSAFFQAVGEGEWDFLAIAIAGGASGLDPVDYAYPCGICRQVMKEFCGDGFLIIVAKSREEYQCYKLAELLPCGFGGENIR